MSESWSETTVGAWAPFHYGKGLPERDRAGGDVPVYGSNGIVGWHNSAAVESAGIIVGRKGTVGSIEYSPRSFWPIDTTYFVTEDPKRNLRFTAAALASLGLEDRNSHSAVPGLSREDAHRLSILVPTLSEQNRIAAVLDALDGHIDCLREVLLTVGETVVAACEAAIDSRSGTDMLALSEAVKLVNGGAYTKGASGSGRMVIRIKELNSGPSESTVYNNITVPAEKVVHPGDVLFAWSGSLGVWRWFGDEAIVNQHIFKVLPARQPVWLGWVHILHELETFRDIAAGKATTMGHITKDHLDRTLVPVLSLTEMEELTALVEPMWEYQLRVGRQLVALENLQAFLVPQLVTGELRVAEVEGTSGVSS